jgi:CheY-like chemotaxis protein
MKKILVIEDENNIRTLISEILRISGYAVVTAENGRIGVQVAESEKPDLVICDVMMPEMDGFGVLAELQQKKDFNAPFIYLTAKAQYEDLRKGMNLGADDYIFKPFKSSDLIKAIESRFSKRAQQLANIAQKTNDLETLVERMVGHEFNTPMNGILSMSRFIKQNVEKFNDKELMDFCNYLDISSARLQSTFSKVRKFIEVKEHEVSKEINSECIDITEIIQQVAKKIAADKNRSKDLELSIAGEFTLNIDANLLFLALYEIIENAFKFSASGDKVIISEEQNDSSCTIKITDQGKKISAEELATHNSFKQFNRDKYEQQGLGIGLALVQSIIEKMNGIISFSNNIPTGIIVTLTFKR